MLAIKARKKLIKFHSKYDFNLCYVTVTINAIKIIIISTTRQSLPLINHRTIITQCFQWHILIIVTIAEKHVRRTDKIIFQFLQLFNYFDSLLVYKHVWYCNVCCTHRDSECFHHWTLTTQKSDIDPHLNYYFSMDYIRWKWIDKQTSCIKLQWNEKKKKNRVL